MSFPSACLHESQSDCEQRRDGEHRIAGGVDVLDGQEAAEVPEQVADAVDGVESEGEGERELESRQRGRAEVQALNRRDDRVRSAGAGQGRDGEDGGVAGEGDAGAAVGDRQHAGQLRLVDREVRRLRAVEARVALVVTFLHGRRLRHDFDRHGAGGAGADVEQSRAAHERAVPEGPGNCTEKSCLQTRFRFDYIIFRFLIKPALISRVEHRRSRFRTHLVKFNAMVDVFSSSS